MPFDGTTYTAPAKTAPIYDKDNPPKRMSEAIRMAVADVEALENTPGYVINLETLHDTTGENCVVCLAGASLARVWEPTGRAKQYIDVGPWKKTVWERVFYALNMVRRGWVSNAYNDWPEGFSMRPVDCRITTYATNPTAFKQDMLSLADRLESEGS